MNTKFYAAFVALVLLSCDLDRFPLDAPSDATFYSNEGELELAVNGVYRSLWWHSQDQQVIQRLDAVTDLGWLRGEPDGLANGSATPFLAPFKLFWVDLYHAIAKANNLISSLKRTQAPDQFKARIEGEAKFLRALHYHYLVEMFGDVPLLSEAPPLSEAQVGRTPKSEVVDFILQDLEFAADNLPVSWTAADAGRATKGAALALMARVALYDERFDIAIEASSAVMEMQTYSLYPDYKNLFQYAGVRNQEVIFDVPYLQGLATHSHPQNAGSRLLGCFSNIAPSQFLVDSYLASDGLPIDQSPLYDPAKPFENRDPRLDASIVRPQSVLVGYVFETHPDSVQTWTVDKSGSFVARVGNLDATNAFATFTGYLWRKYNPDEDYPDLRRASQLNFILIRYAEVLLTYAEASIEKGVIDQSVLDALNRVRARAYGVNLNQTSEYPEITTFDQDELRATLRNERKVELAYEGFRLFDIRRWRIADKVLHGPLIGRPIGAYETIPAPPDIDEETGHPNYGTNVALYRQVMPRTFRVQDWLFPIPQDEINANKNVTQNPGY